MSWFGARLLVGVFWKCAGAEPNDMVESDEDDMKVPNQSDKTWENSLTEQRPPLYNAEDYAHYMRKLNKNPKNYLLSGQDGGKKGKGGKGGKEDYRHPHLTSSNGEMSLKQFNTISELLRKLKQDLKQSFPSFIKEFVGHPNDGVSLLLDVLKMIQLSQTDQTQSAPSNKDQHAMFLRTLQDEYECLVCLKQTMRCDDAPYRLVGYSHGLYTLAVCIMSNVNKSRVIAIELLTRAAETTTLGHQQVLEALSTLRLRVGEPVRFKFLVGMLLSYASPIFQVTCLRFLNKLLENARDPKDKVFLQLEMEQAGFSCPTLRKFLTPQHSHYNTFKEELRVWDDCYIDVNILMERKESSNGNVNQSKDSKDEVERLIKQAKKLEEHENTLKKKYEEMKEKYSRLENEYRNIKNQLQRMRQEREHLQKNVAPVESQSDRSSQVSTDGIREESETESGREMEKDKNKKDDSRKSDSEGLYVEKSPMVEEVMTVQNDTIMMESETIRNGPSSPKPNLSNCALSEFYRNTATEDDEETTIEDVVEELNNIASSSVAISQQNGKHHRRRGSMTELMEKHKRNGCQDDFEDRHSPEGPVKDELIIVPTRVPKPPKKKSENDMITDVVYLSYESPEETSDTESVISMKRGEREGTFSSNRTVESASCKSFGFIRPAVRRRETVMEPPRRHKSTADVRNEKPPSIKRSESFQHVMNLERCSPDMRANQSRKSASPINRPRYDKHDASRDYENLKNIQAVQGSKLSERFQHRVRNGHRSNGHRSNHHVKEETIWNDNLNELADEWTIRWRYPKIPQTTINQAVHKIPEAENKRRSNQNRRQRVNGEHHGRQERRSREGHRKHERRNRGDLEFRRKYPYESEPYINDFDGPPFPNFVQQHGYQGGPKGWIRRGHANAGLYSEYRLADMVSEDGGHGDIQIPTPDYSHTLSPASTMETVVRRDHYLRENQPVRMMDLPAGLY